MQIHELTLKKKSQVNEGIGDFVKGAAAGVGKGVGAVKKFGTDLASPFKDAAAGYRSGKVDAQTNAIADKAYRAWSAYRQQLDKTAPGGKADPATLEKQLMAFVSKNLLGGQYLPNLINKDQIIKLVKQIAGNDAAPPPPPTDTGKPGAPATADAPQDAAATAPAKPAAIEKGKEVAIGNEHYRWLGAQWALVNPKTGAAGKTAEKGIQAELNKMAQAGKFVEPFVSPETGTLGADQMAANKAIGKEKAPYGFDTATGKPLPKPGTGARMGTAPSTPGGAGATAPATPTDEPIYLGGKKLDPKNPNDAKVLATMKAQGKLNEYADLDRKLREAVYKARDNNPNAQDQNPYVQGRAGDGANRGQFAKFDPETSTTANAAAGINAMAAGGQAARNAEKPAPANPANELELFKKLVATAAQAQTEVATGQSSGTPGTGGGAGSNKKVQDPRQMVPDVQNAVAPQVDSGKLKAAGDAIRKNFQIDASIGSTDDDPVDALLIAMGFQPA